MPGIAYYKPSFLRFLVCYSVRAGLTSPLSNWLPPYKTASAYFTSLAFQNMQFKCLTKALMAELWAPSSNTEQCL